ncbi:MAG: hypothetical protein WD077_04160 [Bacteroidia bacterium]
MKQSHQTNLPTENKNHTLNMIVIANIFIILGMSFFLYKFFSPTLLYFFLLIIIADFILSRMLLLRQNIQKVELRDEGLRVMYNAKTIDIDFEKIDDINYALNYYIDFNGKLSLFYTVRLKIKYRFGRNLYFKYSKKGIKDKEPQDMMIIKKQLKTLAN